MKEPAASEQSPSGVFGRGGIFRRIAPRSSSAGTAFAVFEEIFAPTRHAARIEVQAQARVGKPAPAPTDPPDLDHAGHQAPGGRFRGRITIRRPISRS